ncbi:MAG: transporter substrate-binding protein [Xanthobacteraceae bacterium]|nr:transporter substrate-binding protein [Xanthobacteraceae bacterium]
MKRKMLTTLLSSLAALALYAATPYAATPAAAQEWPSRPIRTLTTSSAGGISDIFMRALGEELRQRLGQPIVIENRPGGMQNVGSRACADAPPDGYTICIINADPLVYNQFLIKNMTFNPETGLQPVINLFHLIQVLVINPSLQAKNIDELIAESKAKPGIMNYVTASVPLALYMETLRKEKGADWVRVPFRGGGEAVNAVLGGTTPIALIGEGNVIGQIKAGTVRPLVMLNNLKSPLVPEVPTMEESGYKGAPSRTWYGLFAPAGTPKPIVDRLNKEIREIVSNPDFREKHLTSRSLVPALNTPEEFAKEIIADRALAKQVVKDSGLEPQ